MHFSVGMIRLVITVNCQGCTCAFISVGVECSIITIKCSGCTYLISRGDVPSSSIIVLGMNLCIYFYRGGAPGNRECDASINHINSLINQLDQASLSSSSMSARPRSEVGGSIQAFQEQTLSSARQLLEHVDPIRLAAKGEADNLAHLVRKCCYQQIYISYY